MTAGEAKTGYLWAIARDDRPWLTPSLVAASRLVGREIAVDAVHPAYRPDTVHRPGLALAGRHPLRFNETAISGSDQRPAMVRITANACSEALQSCSPLFGFLTRSSECWSPFQWMTSTTSPTAKSAMISVNTARTNRWRVRIAVCGTFQAAARLSANPEKSGFVPPGSGAFKSSRRLRHCSARCSAASHAFSS